MNRFEVFKRLAWSILAVGVLALAGGCDGSDGKDGANGANGANGAAGADGLSCWDLNGNGVGDVASEDINLDGVVDVNDCGTGVNPIQAAVDMAQIESCATCHAGVGDGHQALYDLYTDGSANGGSNLVIEFDEASLSVVGAAAPYSVSVDFTVTQNGLPLASLSDLEIGNRFYVIRYDNGEYFQPTSLSASGANGAFTASSANVPFDPSTNGVFFSYIADDEVHIGDVNYAAHMALYDNAAAAGFETAGAEAYVSAANVAGCEACHGAPYLKHGNRPAEVAGLQDFAACKACHYDNRVGGHGAWQWMVDDPYAWATEALTNAQVNAAYPYTASVMNDVHMSHAMEFPYPQSMANCATCHAGKLAMVLDNDNFRLETCKSCHPMTGDPAYDESSRAPAFAQLWAANNLTALHSGVDDTTDCTVCHGAGFARSFDAYHTGYDARISDADGNKYANDYTVSIDSISYDDVNNQLQIAFSASDAAIVPWVYVSLYGWDTKDFIIASHSRDANSVRFEYAPESAGGAANALFTEGASVPPNYVVTANFSAYMSTNTADIATLIADGVVSKAMVTIAPRLSVDGVNVGLNGVVQNFDFMTNAVIGDYFSGTDAIVDYQKCNACHDQLAVTFHGGSGRGGDIAVCRNCHVSTSGGSHLEMQSRSIEGYVHAIHTFQAFDPGDIFEPAPDFDPVAAKHYAEHIEHTFPNFTITNCESCHNPGTYNVPDQSKSMPGLLSASDSMATWYELVETSGANTVAVENPAGRNIGTVPEYVVGPASKACGGCHRAEFINEDAAGELASWNAHTDAFGTLVENDTLDNQGTALDDEYLYGIIDKIMTLFE